MDLFRVFRERDSKPKQATKTPEKPKEKIEFLLQKYQQTLREVASFYTTTTTDLLDSITDESLSKDNMEHVKVLQNTLTEMEDMMNKTFDRMKEDKKKVMEQVRSEHQRVARETGIF